MRYWIRRSAIRAVELLILSRFLIFSSATSVDGPRSAVSASTHPYRCGHCVYLFEADLFKTEIFGTQQDHQHCGVINFGVGFSGPSDRKVRRGNAKSAIFRQNEVEHALRDRTMISHYAAH